MEGRCINEKPLSFSAGPRSDVLAEASNEQPAFAWRTQRATAMAICGEEAQHARLRRARAVSRWLWSVRSL